MKSTRACTFREIYTTCAGNYGIENVISSRMFEKCAYIGIEL